MSRSTTLDARVAAVERLVRTAIAAGTATCAVFEVGDAEGATGRFAAGRLGLGADAAVAEPGTIFDLASLTKVLATTLLAMRLEEAGRYTIADPVGRWWPAWHGPGRDDTTIADLLAHASGLPAHRPLYERCRGSVACADAICRLPLESAPRSAAV